MMVMRLHIDAPALAAFDDRTVRVVMGDVDHQFRLADAAAIGLVAAAFAKRRAGDMGFNLAAGDVFGVDDHHFKLRHQGLLALGGAFTMLRGPREP